jgi:ATP-dependent exoDNAse (exonuclease V) alpha subunit
VQELNDRIRRARLETGEIAAGVSLQTERGTREMSVGDRTAFLRNDRDLGVYNGKIGTIETIDRTVGETPNDTAQLQVRLDVDKGVLGRLVSVATGDYSKPKAELHRDCARATIAREFTDMRRLAPALCA